MPSDLTARLAPLRDWFFEEGDAAAAAAMRIGYGLVLLFMLWDVSPVRDLLLGHAGYFGTLDPKYVAVGDPTELLFRFDSSLALRIYFGTFAAVALCATVGLCTRANLAASLFLLLLFQKRNTYMLFGADGVLLQIAIWMLFLRSGRVWSLDRVWRERRGRAIPRVIPLWPLKAIQLQVVAVYLVTGLTKIGTEPWQDGSAIYYGLRSLGSGLLPGLLDHKLALTLLTYGTLWVELSFAFLVFWKPTRWIALLSAVALHAGIDALMSIRFFGPVMYLGLLSFVRPEEWLRVEAWVVARLSRRGQRSRVRSRAGETP